METTITVREMAAIKRIAQNSNVLVTKKNRLKDKLKALLDEISEIESQIEADEAGVIKKYGVTSEVLVEKKVVTTDKLDKTGYPIKVTKYEPTSNVVWNEDKKVYIYTLEETNEELVEEAIPVFDDNGEVVG